MKIKTIFYILSAAFLPVFTADAGNGIAKNNAQMQAMDKITGRVDVINVPVDGEVKFGSLSIVVRSCKTRPAEEAPDNFAFVDIADKTLQGEEFNIFKGWMISSSPATHAVEHPIYDVWLLQCTDEKHNPENILTAEQLAKRDDLPKKSSFETNTAKNSAGSNKIKMSHTINELESQNDNSAPTETELQPQGEFFYDDEESAATAEEENAEAEENSAPIETDASDTSAD